MLVGQILYLLGLAFVFFSIVFIIMNLILGGVGGVVIPLFALLNGLIAMGVGDMVIDLNYNKKKLEKNKSSI
ncbi:hypothetical protein FZC79_05565 [Rossellomorea vietnamensis]|uniref:Uncharacterized protein n=2 Tax=Rossellomorea TaxID=2837508 RepID=A0A5D4KHE6_9BACI|nr:MULTISPECIES: hypothetical protein [Rossellomorea]TYR76356.1 hypothetical protein FZC79_05565 [Rossellomorea vietnamensis]TYS76297.1 hypothetical protein FZC80_15275 [Rossellomorea aquimaris]